MKFEMETLREIWNGEDKSHYEVGPDRDGLQCVEIRYRDEAGKIGERMTFPPEMARLISVALTKCAYELSTPNPGHHAEPRLGGDSVNGVVGGKKIRRHKNEWRKL